MRHFFSPGNFLSAAFTSVIVAGSLPVMAAAPYPVETCEQIRTLIGELPPANAEFLRKLAARRDCRFTSAEVARAAYGDRATRNDERDREDHHVKDDD
ncbi:hypothetical protein [Aromatoleum petrolei]|uniref:Uncharacterized protein n=1 Tax=Aromatoleum petrolei TaxID=76116 RepID=A0ABX1MVW7_9RHOO|nr:hypothetical protein [Aromatoleum petrolei]NMF91405.1 hypothetical protein [Aromatoleum petrolei]QTQ34616.1 Uncharacterized protein ToN1_04450 [Aromatoleum petrolei]